MPIRRMKNDGHPPGGLRRRTSAGVGRPLKTRAPVVAGVEECIWEDCDLGPLDARLDLAVIRFTLGFVKTIRSGPIFEEKLLFPDLSRHKFAHAVCAYDAGVRVNELSMEFCTLPKCNTNFMCSRHSGLTDYDGLYLPNKDAEWGCEPEGCLLLEHGYFQSKKGGRFVTFVPEKRGAVHWACARAEWSWDKLSGMYAQPPPEFRPPETHREWVDW